MAPAVAPAPASLHPRETLIRAALALADCDGEDEREYTRAADRLRKAAASYIRRTRGGRPERVHIPGEPASRG